MKKVLIVIATLLTCAMMAFGICACDSNGDSGNGGNGGNVNSEDTGANNGDTPNSGDANNNGGSDTGNTGSNAGNTGSENTGSGNTENNGSGNESETLLQFTGVLLENATVTYDGAQHSLSVEGMLPAGTQVDYENNGKTDVGEYAVKATLSKDGYESKILNAKLTIIKAQFTDVTLESKKFIHTGATHSLEVKGALPEGTTVTYQNNGQKEVGEYNVTATLTNPNYETKTLDAVLTISSKTNIALSIINDLLDKPDPWNFIPEALKPENMAYSQMPVGGLDGFANNVSTSQISKKSIGKQFNVLYEGLCDSEKLLANVDLVFTAGTTIADVYQTFINSNPDDYASFTGEAAGFKVKILLDSEKSKMLAGNSAMNLELEYDSETQTRTGRIQVTSGATVKYTSTPTSLKLAVKMSIAGVGNLKQIEFIRNGENVAGYLREFTGTESKNLKTTGVIAVNEKTAVIMSNKRESDDLKINGYEEVYSSVTGELLGCEVLETVKIVDYDTLWFHLGDVSGFTGVRVEDTANGLNADSIFVNGQNSLFKPAKVITSRSFDIEMKEVWYVVEEIDGGKTSYNLQKTLIPMLFVQKEKIDSFTSDVNKQNSYITSATLPAQNINKIYERFDDLKALFDAVLNEVTYQDIDIFIGSKDEFFN